MFQQRTAEGPAAIAPGRRFPRVRSTLRVIWISLVVTSVFALVFVVSLLVTLPTSALREFATVPAQVTGLYGRIWDGQASLDGGYTLDWAIRPGQLLTGRAVFDATLSGPDTRLQGTLFATPWEIGASNVTGRAGPGLLGLLPGLALRDCTSRAVADISGLSIARGAAAAAGVVSVDAGVCKDALQRDAPIPAMRLELSTQGNDAQAQLRDRDSELARLTVTGDRRAILRLEPEGAVLVPGLPTSGPVIVEYPF